MINSVDGNKHTITNWFKVDLQSRSDVQTYLQELSFNNINPLIKCVLYKKASGARPLMLWDPSYLPCVKLLQWDARNMSAKVS